MENLKEIVRLVRELRAPGGCPWDREQDLKTMQPIILEEVYELIEAMDQEDWESLKGEAADLIWDLVFIVEIAREKEKFSLAEVFQHLKEKIVRRHPHVWGPDKTDDPEKIRQLYYQVKKKEKEQGGKGQEKEDIFSAIPETLPALFYAYKVQKKALRKEKWKSDDSEKIPPDQLGEKLFRLVSQARQAGINPELALREYTACFKKKVG